MKFGAFKMGKDIYYNNLLYTWTFVCHSERVDINAKRERQSELKFLHGLLSIVSPFKLVLFHPLCSSSYVWKLLPLVYVVGRNAYLL